MHTPRFWSSPGGADPTYPKGVWRQLGSARAVCLGGTVMPFMPAVRSSGGLCDVLHFVREITAGGWRRQRFTVGLVERDRFLDNSAQLVEHLPFIVAMAATVDQTGRTSDVALILFRPFDNLHVSSALFHFFDSSIASCTART